MGNEKKPSGVYRTPLALRDFKQKEYEQYRKDDKSAPVMNKTSIKVVMVLIILGAWYTKVIDVEGAFLHGYFQRWNEKLYTSIPKGFEKYYPYWAILLCLKTIYGTIHGAIQWWREICKAMYYLKWKRHAVDPCLFVKWIDGKLLIFLLLTDGLLDFRTAASCWIQNKGIHQIVQSYCWRKNMEDYVGCKANQTLKKIQLTQPVKIRRFENKFGYTGEGV